MSKSTINIIQRGHFKGSPSPTRATIVFSEFQSAAIQLGSIKFSQSIPHVIIVGILHNSKTEQGCESKVGKPLQYNLLTTRYKGEEITY